jgi:hypothetical protein
VRKTLPPPKFDPRTVQPVAGRYSDYWLRTSHKLISVISSSQDGDYKESLLLRHHVACWKCTDISDNCVASVFSVYQPRRWWLQLAPKRRCACVCTHPPEYMLQQNSKQQSLPTDLSKMVKVRSVCFSKYFLVTNAANGLGSIYEFKMSIFVLNY